RGRGCRAGLRARIGAAFAAGSRVHDHLDPRRDADPAQRLPSTQEATRMTDEILSRRTPDPSATAEYSHGAEWEARTTLAPLNTMGAKVTIQKNWQELIRPNKLQVSPGQDGKREATLIPQPLHRPFALTPRNAPPR